MYTVTIRFYEELNDFLKDEQRKKDIVFSFADRRSVKDLVESMGVPHVEIDLILVNGVSVAFDYIVQDNDRISVYPVFELFDISPLVHLRARPLRETKFVCDVHLGALARKLRMMGFDTLYKNDYTDATLASISHDEGRILLTRDRQLLMRTSVEHGIYVRGTDSLSQAAEIVRKLDVYSSIAYFSRCGECNGLLENKSLDAIRDRAHEIPSKVREWITEYSVCISCGHIYWNGTHGENFIRDMESVLDEKNKGSYR